MDKKDLSNLEDQIMSTVSNALKAIDFANLKKDINDKTENTLNQVKSKFNGYSEKYMRLNKKAKNDISKYISKRPAGSMSGILYILFGISGCLVYGSSVLIFIIFKILFGMIGSNVLFVSAFLLLVVSVGLLLRGITLRKRVKRFKKYVRFIDDNNYFLINDLAFYKEEIAVKLDKLGNISNQILVQVEKNPNKIQEVNKFINHYLPITIKLINSYKDINNQSVQGENIENAKLEIEKSIDLINSAFENLLDDLYEDVVLDISTDISVLKTLFKQEGLTEDDFKK